MAVARAAFFFGSGISYSSFAPFGKGAGSVARITERIFNEDWLPGPRMFVPAPAGTHAVLLEETKRVQALIRLIKDEIDPRLLARLGREGHYEDIYAAALQIFQDVSLEIPSPLIGRSLDALRSASSHLWTGGPKSAFGDEFATLVGRALELVQSVVLEELGKARDPIGLKPIAEVAKAIPEVDIFTLNHDQLVEEQLRRSGVGFADGFGEDRAGYRIFNAHWPPGNGVRILKLHGSLNWYFCRFKRFHQYAAFNLPIEKCTDDDGTRIDVEPLPEFLTGTTVKEQSYGHSMIGEQFARFRHLTSQHRRIIFCGYGWEDKGINIRIDQWLHDQRENRLIILHALPLKEITDRKFWWRRWAKYHAAGKVEVVDKWLSDCSPADVEAMLTR